jgi:hypothetical protein
MAAGRDCPGRQTAHTAPAIPRHQHGSQSMLFCAGCDCRASHLRPLAAVISSSTSKLGGNHTGPSVKPDSAGPPISQLQHGLDVRQVYPDSPAWQYRATNKGLAAGSCSCAASLTAHSLVIRLGPGAAPAPRECPCCPRGAWKTRAHHVWECAGRQISGRGTRRWAQLLR